LKWYNHSLVRICAWGIRSWILWWIGCWISRINTCIGYNWVIYCWII